MVVGGRRYRTWWGSRSVEPRCRIKNGEALLHCHGASVNAGVFLVFLIFFLKSGMTPLIAIPMAGWWSEMTGPSCIGPHGTRVWRLPSSPRRGSRKLENKLKGGRHHASPSCCWKSRRENSCACSYSTRQIRLRCGRSVIPRFPVELPVQQANG
ncbi:hypothetical protein BDZ91DRAFT_400033 [Kalaharituber pfeilii]|nr:hypothetical protein BDZ91DRAFT_400033 [Kalaharituber pfeilii]